MKKGFITVLLSVLLSVLAAYGVVKAANVGESEKTTLVQDGTVTRTVNLAQSDYPDLTYAAEAAVEAVVYVEVTATQQYQIDDPFFRFFFGESTPQSRQVQGSGSGVIIRQDGYIVTNNHVIAGADVIEVTLENNKVYPAKLVGTDPATDIALIKIDAEDLPAIRMGNSDDLRLGEWVLAIGSPYDLRSTITAGIVSAKGRSMPNYDGQYRVESFIQTDAAVNPGNSGGALVNAAGDLVGINTSIISRTGSYAGYSFAVPVNIVSKVVDDFIEYGSVQRAMLGVSITDVTAQLADQADLTEIDGVYVMDVQRDSPAEKGGIQKGDVIKEVNLNSVHNSAGLQEQISKLRPGEKAVVTVFREGHQHEIIVTL